MGFHCTQLLIINLSSSWYDSNTVEKDIKSQIIHLLGGQLSFTFQNIIHIKMDIILCGLLCVYMQKVLRGLVSGSAKEDKLYCHLTMKYR